MKKLLIVLLVILSFRSIAQTVIVDSPTLRFRINADIQPNNNGSITASKLNTLLNGQLNVTGNLLKKKVDSVWSSGTTLYVKINGNTYTYSISSGTGLDTLKGDERWAKIQTVVDSLAAIQTRIQTKQPLLGYTPLQPSYNLSDVNNVGTARINLGVYSKAEIDNSFLNYLLLSDSNNKYTTPFYLSAYYYNKAQSDARYLQNYTETDSIYTASSWYGTTNNHTNWDAAYGWGNHAGLYRPVYWVPAWSDVTGKPVNFSTTFALSNDLKDSIQKRWDSAKVKAWGNLTFQPIGNYLTSAYYQRILNSGASTQPQENSLQFMSPFSITDNAGVSTQIDLINNGITNAKLVNSTIVINGTSVSLGGSINGLLSSSNYDTTNVTLRHINYNTQTSNYTLALTDDGKQINVNNASATTVTIPNNSSVAFPVGTVIIINQDGAGAITVAGASGVTVNYYSGSSLTTYGQYDMISLIKRDTNTWQVRH